MPHARHLTGMPLMFAADNVDHDVRTVDGLGTFHGMGMIGVVNPRNVPVRKIPRKPANQLDIVRRSRVDILQYRAAACSVARETFTPLKPVPRRANSTVDILGQMGMKYKQPIPNWGGSMHLLHRSASGLKSSIYFLDMIDMKPGDGSCVYSTVKYLDDLAHAHGLPTVITFDQSLYWKAAEIVQETGDLKSVVLMLGSFYSLMNLLGATGTLMDGSGLAEILRAVYADNTVDHMLTGKAVERALRGHLPDDQCLYEQIADKCFTENDNFAVLVDTLKEKYVAAAGGVNDPPINDETILIVVKMISAAKEFLKSNSATSKLWASYQDMLQVVRDLIRGDRLGDFAAHTSAMNDCLPIMAAAGHL